MAENLWRYRSCKRKCKYHVLTNKILVKVKFLGQKVKKRNFSKDFSLFILPFGEKFVPLYQENKIYEFKTQNYENRGSEINKGSKRSSKPL